MHFSIGMFDGLTVFTDARWSLKIQGGDKELVSKIYKELFKLNTKKTIELKMDQRP